MTKLSISSQLAFSFTLLEVKALGAEYIDTEHLFLGLCKIEDVLNLNIDDFRDISEEDWQEILKDVSDFSNILVDNGLNLKKTRRTFRRILYESQSEKKDFSGHRTKRCKKVFEIAEELNRNNEAKGINLKYLLISILTQNSPYLDLLFQNLSINKETFLDSLIVSTALKKEQILQLLKENQQNDKDSSIEESQKTKTLFLDKFGRNLSHLAKEGKLEPVIGRKEEIKKLAQILVQKKKNNPILVGDAGVGKTCIVEALAQKTIDENAPLMIKNFKIIELSMGSLVAGTKYRGDFEERLDNIIKEASSDPNIVLFIDEIHTMIGAGASGGEAMDAGNILKPALARGQIKCIGATTTVEYRKYIEKDSALERRFQLVWVDEPTKEETIQILKGLKPNYENYYKVKIADNVIEKAVELSIRYLTDFKLPDKAIDIIDQTCAQTILNTLSPAKLNNQKSIKEITITDIAKIVSKRCRIPAEILSIEESDKLLKMEEYLVKRVMGQDHAIKEIAETIRTTKAGLKDPQKPVGVFLFLGSTGTGKTELAKALAEFLFLDEKKLLIFDMSEYQEKQSVSKLIGAPPGYIGYDEEGQLTGKVRTNPYSVILFDEIEKAHPDIFDIFLQIFDEGRLTDTHGRKVNFSESIIILTSNLGSTITSSHENKPKIGINLEKQNNDDGKSQSLSNVNIKNKQWGFYEEQINHTITKTFKPELLNRIQKKIIFYPLDKQTIKQIIIKILDILNKRLSNKGIEVSLSDDSIDFLIAKGYNEKYGARNMQRTFDAYITEPLSKMILNNYILEGQIIFITVSEEKLDFKISDKK